MLSIGLYLIVRNKDFSYYAIHLTYPFLLSLIEKQERTISFYVVLHGYLPHLQLKLLLQPFHLLLLASLFYPNSQGLVQVLPRKALLM